MRVYLNGETRRPRRPRRPRGLSNAKNANLLEIARPTARCTSRVDVSYDWGSLVLSCGRKGLSELCGKEAGDSLM
ncbi:hypothetical protein EVAR_61203_1 [Eumeta japonica]|uniref:Uncharacterized protein n=1 Tax=Eumeta variegata TaxID=151549 RepID=A0A4C1YWT1_EUMVA|nr:hypothetical protein EVAR_61203_1 [Eumeta japonica]